MLGISPNLINPGFEEVPQVSHLSRNSSLKEPVKASDVENPTALESFLNETKDAARRGLARWILQNRPEQTGTIVNTQPSNYDSENNLPGAPGPQPLFTVGHSIDPQLKQMLLWSGIAAGALILYRTL